MFAGDDDSHVVERVEFDAIDFAVEEHARSESLEELVRHLVDAHASACSLEQLHECGAGAAIGVDIDAGDAAAGFEISRNGLIAGIFAQFALSFLGYESLVKRVDAVEFSVGPPSWSSSCFLQRLLSG